MVQVTMHGMHEITLTWDLGRARKIRADSDKDDRTGIWTLLPIPCQQSKAGGTHTLLHISRKDVRMTETFLTSKNGQGSQARDHSPGTGLVGLIMVQEGVPKESGLLLLTSGAEYLYIYICRVSALFLPGFRH